MPEGSVENVLGGTPTYSGLTLANLNEKVGIVSKVGEESPELFFSGYDGGTLDTSGILIGSGETTRFENKYFENGRRDQVCNEFSGTIETDDIPVSYMKANGFYISPILNEISPEMLEKISNNSEGDVMFDPQGAFRKVKSTGEVVLEKPGNLEEYLRHVDIVKIGMDELTVFDKSSEKVLKDLLCMGPRVAILTLGKNGAKVMAENEEIIEVDALDVEPKDITGAGDVFGAAFLHDYLKNKDLERAANFANAAAGLKIRYEGPTGFPDMEKIREALEN